ncbi:hypothetical protein [Legionella israelensis]|uniref:Phage holin family protein n=1 Tax=Legionella israelensis TaxID=454 RepID=A0A0W0W385_9GAMM|nr:hypothetical protein [Legionella israelensis]KTD26843.1 hypothetical protein Lisr_1054 [Legionella israelensis]QBS08512.1 hypothetical protein E4T55_00755 [Legionella israelensis]SCX76884.1 hypothetical protein SAMN02746069_00096 [Legionella israelensis DSM 19235]STX58161.1 Uncharacterised protein [Legionella israelensis]
MKAIDELTGLVSSKLEVFKAIFSLIKLEIRLAGLSVFPLLLNLCLLIVILLSTWISIMVLGGYVLEKLFDSIFLALVSVCGLNILFFIILLRYLKFNLKKMSFEKTRQILADTKGSNTHDLQERDNTGHSRN